MNNVTGATLIVCLLTGSLRPEVDWRYKVYSNIKEKKVVIGYPYGMGMFGAICGMVNVFAWCEKQAKTPVVYWGPGNCASAPYYQEEGFNGSTNVWEYYFEPVSDDKYVPGDKINYGLYVPDENLLPPRDTEAKTWDHRDLRRKIKPYLDKYVKVKPEIMKKVDTFYEEHIKGKKTIALHLRGTDKVSELTPVSVEAMCTITQEYASKNPGCQFFVCSDELSLLERAQELLKGNVITYDVYRSKDGKPLHLDHGHGQSPAKIGEDVIIEVLLMSRCDLLIHTWGNVSLGAMYFNPTLDTVLVLPTREILPSCMNWPT